MYPPLALPPYKVDTSRPSLRTDRACLVPSPVLTGHAWSDLYWEEGGGGGGGSKRDLFEERALGLVASEERRGARAALEARAPLLLLLRRIARRERLHAAPVRLVRGEGRGVSD